MIKFKALIASAAVAAGISAAVPAGAAADTFNCDATAVQGALLGSPLPPIGTANAGQTQCQNANGTAVSIPAGLGLPLTANAVQAQTTLSANGQNATAIGGVGNIGIGLGNTLLSQITGPISQAITGSATPTQIAVGPVPNLLGALLPGSASLSASQLATSQSAIQASINTLLQNALNGNLLSTSVLTSTATATCVNGQPQLAGSSNLVGPLNVLGQNFDPNAATSQALTLINTAQLGQIDISSTVNTLTNNVIAGLGLSGLAGSNPLLVQLIGPTQAALATQIGPQINKALQPVLQAVATALDSFVRLTVQPRNQIVGNGQLTQQALHINLTLNPNATGGLPTQQVLDLVIGQARVSNASVSCPVATPPPPPAGTAASQAALACSNRNLELIDVLRHGNHTFIEGAAKLNLVGQTIPIFFGPNRKQVTTAVVQPDGFFRATAPLPPKGIRGSNKARYFAKANGETTLRLKFHRRMIVSGTTVSGGMVHITGKISRPLAKPVAKIIIQRRVTCTSTVNVSSVKPGRNGKFSIDVPSPPGAQVGVYRAKTVVRKTTKNPKRFPTFTLPRFVTL